MWGDRLRYWFELFAGMAIYKSNATGGHVNDGWINPDDIESRFRVERLLVQGRAYDGADNNQRNQLFEAILNNAGALCTARLLERRRQITPPSLDYRVTPFGRKIDKWGYGDKPGLRKRAAFFALEAWFRLRRYKLVAIGSAGWAAINAFKFYSAAWQWIHNDFFALISAVVIAALLWAFHRVFPQG